MKIFNFFFLFMINLLRKIVSNVERNVLLPRFRSVGKNFIFFPHDSIINPEAIKIGNDVFIGPGAYFGGDIEVRDRVMFGPNVSVLAANHIFGVVGKSPRFLTPATPDQNISPVVIEDDVWIGANVTILGGLCIGMGAVVGAGSVVTKDIIPFTVSVGSPCIPVRRIFSNELLLEHLMLTGYSRDFALKVISQREEKLQGSDIPVIDNTKKYPVINYIKPHE